MVALDPGLALGTLQLANLERNGDGEIWQLPLAVVAAGCDRLLAMVNCALQVESSYDCGTGARFRQLYLRCVAASLHCGVADSCSRQRQSHASVCGRVTVRSPLHAKSSRRKEGGASAGLCDGNPAWRSLQRRFITFGPSRRVQSPCSQRSACRQGARSPRRGKFGVFPAASEAGCQPALGGLGCVQHAATVAGFSCRARNWQDGWPLTRQGFLPGSSWPGCTGASRGSREWNPCAR